MISMEPGLALNIYPRIPRHYGRHGISTFFAAIDVADFITQCKL
jgi:hypothetical protein